jgi:hypothetical protein
MQSGGRIAECDAVAPLSHHPNQLLSLWLERRESAGSEKRSLLALLLDLSLRVLHRTGVVQREILLLLQLNWSLLRLLHWIWPNGQKLLSLEAVNLTVRAIAGQDSTSCDVPASSRFSKGLRSESTWETRPEREPFRSSKADATGDSTAPLRVAEQIVTMRVSPHIMAGQMDKLDVTGTMEVGRVVVRLNVPVPLTRETLTGTENNQTNSEKDGGKSRHEFIAIRCWSAHRLQIVVERDQKATEWSSMVTLVLEFPSRITEGHSAGDVVSLNDLEGRGVIAVGQPHVLVGSSEVTQQRAELERALWDRAKKIPIAATLTHDQSLTDGVEETVAESRCLAQIELLLRVMMRIILIIEVHEGSRASRGSWWSNFFRRAWGGRRPSTERLL